MIVALAGCIRGASGFHCDTSTECGAGGTCEPGGLCSFPDQDCASGRRFGSASGSASNTCVGAVAIDAGVDGPADARPTDAPIDAPPMPPMFVTAAHAHNSGVASLTYALAIPSGTNLVLVTSVQVASDCNTGTVTVSGVTYNGVALTRIAQILGTPCNANETRSEQWLLAAPSTGNHNVVVTLGGTSVSVLSTSLVFSNVNQSTPVRASMTAAGSGMASTVTVTSAMGDIVVNTVGHGGGVVAPGMNQTQRVLDNVDTSNSLNNQAASTAPGNSPTTTMTWTFATMDEWQTISSSLQP